MSTPSPFHQKWQEDPNGFLVEITGLLKAHNWAGPTPNIHENTANITKKVMSWVDIRAINDTKASLQQYRDEVGALLIQCGEFQLQSVCSDAAAAIAMADFVAKIKLSDEARGHLEGYRQNLWDSLARRVDGELVPLTFQHLEAVKQGIMEGGPHYRAIIDRLVRFNEPGAAYCRQAYLLLEQNDWEGLKQLGDMPLPSVSADEPENGPANPWWKFW